MTDTASAPATAAAPLGLFARIIGVITSPRATFENVAAFPRPAGILLVVALVMGVATAVPQFTAAGKQTALDAQLRRAERSGQEVTPESRAVLEKLSQYQPYILFVGTLIGLPVMSLVIAGLYWAAFNVVLGGTAVFKQVLAIITHSQVTAAVGVLLGLPFMLMKPTAAVGGPFNLGALVPNLEEGSRLAAMLGGISPFAIWGVFVTAIGLGVLYKRKTTGIFVALMVVFLLITFGFALLVTR